MLQINNHLKSRQVELQELDVLLVPEMKYDKKTNKSSGVTYKQHKQKYSNDMILLVPESVY